MAAKLSLLGDDDGSDGEAAPTLRINEAYAKRLEHNKRREDLHRLQELKKRGLAESDSSSDDEEEDEDGILPEKTEVRILDTLARIKNKDPSIYRSDVRFFDGEDDDEEDGEGEEGEASEKKKKKMKPVYLKDVVAKQALESSEEDEEEGDGKPAFKTYAQEQQELKDELRKSIAEAMDENEDNGDALFKVRKKSKEELKEEEEEAERLRKEAPISKKLEECFGKDDDLDENDIFLKDYLRNQGWIDKDKDTLPSYKDVIGEVSDEEAELDEEDEYEAVYNFRFEEGGDSQVLGHSRVIEDSVRKISEKRKERRRKKQERIAQAELARQEEVKRLKNVKKKEMMEKMSKIQTIAGIKSGLEEDDLEEDFDPDEHDKKMQQLFGEDYYNEEDPDFHSDDEAAAAELDIDFDDGDDEMKIEKSEKGLNRNLDYEDMVGDLPTRFHYAQVKPNRFGLSPAQILEAEDKELNQYVSLKAMAPYRTEEWIPRGKHLRLLKKEKEKKVHEGTDSAATHDQTKTKKAKKKKKKITNQQPHEDSEPFSTAPLSDRGELDKKRKHEATGEPQDSSKKKKRKHKAAEVVTNGEKLQKAGKKPIEEIKALDNAAAPDSNATENGQSKKKRKRRKQGLNMSRSRLISYGKLDLPKKRQS